MSTRRLRWRVLGACVGAGLVLAGCTSTAADGPSSSGTTASASVVTPSSIAASSAAPSPTPSVASVPPASSAVVTSLDPAAQEAADRAAVEAQWTKFWVTYDGIVRLPKSERLAQLELVAVSPITDSIIKAADYADSQGIDNYGRWIHRLSWLSSIDGGTTAIIADCQDQSETGTYKVSSGEILTTGKARTNLRGEFVRSADGVWRLKKLYAIGDREC